MKIKEGFAMRNIAGSNIVVPVGKNAGEFNGMITLNSSGAFFWNCFLQNRSEAEVVELVLNEYEADRETVEKDVADFVALLKNNGIIE